MTERPMKDSGIEWIGEIPYNWQLLRIKSMANDEENSFMDGDWIESPYIESEGIRYLTTGNIGDGCFKQQGDGYISEKTFYDLGCKFAYPGDLVFSRLNAPYGRSCILASENDKYVLAVDNVILRTDNDKRFLTFVSMCDGWHHSVEDFATGTTMKRISRTNLGKLYMAIPSKEEQIRIANFLDKKVSEIDNAIEKTKQSIEEYKKLKQSIITEAVTKGLNPDVEMKDSGIEWIGQIPNHWKISKISNQFTFIGGYAFDSDGFMEEGINQVLRIGNIKSDKLLLESKPVYITDDSIQKNFEVKKDYVLFTMTGTKGKQDYFFTVCIDETMTKEKRLYLNQRVGAFVQYGNILPKFLTYYTKLKNVRDHIFLFETGTVNQGNLGIDSIKRTPIVAPSVNEQQEIVEYLDVQCSKYDELILKKEHIIDELEQYKKSLIYEYVTGKKEVA